MDAAASNDRANDGCRNDAAVFAAAVNDERRSTSVESVLAGAMCVDDAQSSARLEARRPTP